MKSVFKATAVLSASSVASIIFGFASSKILATVLGPSGYGYYGLLQSFLSLVVLAAGMGMATGLVRFGAAPASKGDEAALASLRGGAWLLFGGVGILTMAVLLLFRVQLSRWALGTADHSTTIILLGIGILFTVATNIQVGTLNAYHRVAKLAKYGVANTGIVAVITILAVLFWHSQGIVFAIIAGTAANWAIAWYFLRQEVGSLRRWPSFADSLKSAQRLVSFGGPFLASSLVGTGVQLILPIVVLHLLDTESVGYYRAALGISVGYVGFLITAMGQDYYPRVSAVKDDPKALIRLINEQHFLLMLLVVPMVLGTLTLVPILVPLAYSSKFTPTVDILEWQLIGDIFKFASWTMSYAMLARSRPSVYFMTEAIGGASTLLMTWLGVRWLGLTGLGVGFVASYVVYYLAVWIIIRRDVPLVWTSANKKMILAGVAAAVFLRILPSTPLAVFRTPLGLIMACGAGIPCLQTVWREFIQPRRRGLQSPLSAEVPNSSVNS